MKKFILVLISFVLCFSLFSCETATTDSGRTVIVNPDCAPYVDLYYGAGYRVVYSSINGVIYHYSEGNSSGNLAPLYNRDGSLMVYPDDWTFER